MNQAAIDREHTLLDEWAAEALALAIWTWCAANTLHLGSALTAADLAFALVDGGRTERSRD